MGAMKPSATAAAAAEMACGENENGTDGNVFFIHFQFHSENIPESVNNRSRSVLQKDDYDSDFSMCFFISSARARSNLKYTLRRPRARCGVEGASNHLEGIHNTIVVGSPEGGSWF